jgi:hypothetical protein
VAINGVSSDVVVKSGHGRFLNVTGREP